MKQLYRTLMIGSFAVLAACGPLQTKNPTANMLRGIYNAVKPGESTEAAAPGTALTRAFIDAQPAKILRVSIISRETTGLVPFAARNGDTVTWMTAEGLSLIFRNGLLAGTRGFGDDLMGADLNGAVSSLRSGGNHIRTLDFMNGLDQIERRRFECSTVRTGQDTITIVEKSYATEVFEESCTGPTGTFKNTYWRDANGIIWQSRQWISDGVGYLGYQRL